MKLGLRFRDPKLVRRFAEAARPGAYLRILGAGELGAGDAVELLSRPDHEVTIELVSRSILLDETLLARAAAAPQLPQELAGWMLDRAA
jgi:MOSC domain-containing protein YiiM